MFQLPRLSLNPWHTLYNRNEMSVLLSFTIFKIHKLSFFHYDRVSQPVCHGIVLVVPSSLHILQKSCRNSTISSLWSYFRPMCATISKRLRTTALWSFSSVFYFDELSHDCALVIVGRVDWMFLFSENQIKKLSN